jgi:hypothetical protein
MKRNGGRLMAISLIALIISGVVISAAKTMNTDPVLVQQMGLVFALGVFGLVGGFLLWLLGVVFGGTAVSSSRTKKCPQCAEDVKADARICRFCRHEFARNAPV